jgi:glycine dehydrogenase
MISIRKEIEEIETGKADKLNNVLKNAPHTAKVALSDKWDKPYSREKAVYPLSWVKSHKFWPTVGRIDSAYGDRNLVCSCLPTEDFIKEMKEEAVL